jgi:hypothetical protein
MATEHSQPAACPEYHTTACSRRDLLQAGVLGTLGLGLSDLLRAEARAGAARRAPVQSVIFFDHYGAPSHIDLWDLKPQAPEEIRGEFRPIATSVPGYVVCEHMPRIARLVDRMTVVRSMGHRVANHNPATYLMLTGRTSTADIVQVGATPGDWPNPGAVLSKLRPGSGRLPDWVVLPHLTFDQVYITPGQFGGLLGKRYDPFIIARDPSRPDFAVRELQLQPEVSVARLDDRLGLLRAIDRQQRRAEQHPAHAGMDQYYERAWSLLTSPAAKQAFDLAQEPEAVRDRYGRNIVGQSLLLTRRLVEAGVRFVTCYHGLNPGDFSGWDTHRGNFTGLKDRLLPPEDQGFSALVEDLEQRGLLDSTLVIWCGEFGRSPKIGKAAVTTRIDRDGRDHWPFAYSIALLGGGVKRGYVCGQTDKIGAYPVDQPYSPADLAATLYWALGLDPHAEIRDALGRPFPLAEGKPAVEWFG